MIRFTRFGLALIAGLLFAAMALNAVAAPLGTLTTRAAMLKPLATGVEIKPILTAGDMVGNYMMSGTPDGLGAYDNGNGTFTLFMNHEWTTQGNENVSDTRVSKLVLDKKTLEVKYGQYVVDGGEGYGRFCAASMVGPKEGFPNWTFLTGEESTGGKYKGMSVAIDAASGKVTQLPGLGLLNHENIIAVPWQNRIVLMTFDDGAPGGVYMYLANSVDDVMNNRGQLYVFRADGMTSEDKIHKGQSTTGQFVAINGNQPDYKGLTTEAASKGAFKFVRPEDGAYWVSDPTTIFFNVTGRSQYTDTVTTKPYDAKGRTYKMKLDPADPTRVTELKVLMEGDAGDDLINPDNIATSEKYLIVLEDQNGEFNGIRPGHVVAFNIGTGEMTHLAEIIQADYNRQPIPKDKAGDWESSGIINAADLLGPDWWLLDVQAHTLKVDQLGGKDESGQLLAIRVPGSAPAPMTAEPVPGGDPSGTPGGTVPGMPRTGQPNLLPTVLSALAAGLMFALAGLALRRRIV